MTDPKPTPTPRNDDTERLRLPAPNRATDATPSDLVIPPTAKVDPKPGVSNDLPALHQGPKNVFTAHSSLILRFHNTGRVISLRIPHSVVLGRGTVYDMGDKLDLTEFNGYQLGVSRQHCQLRRDKLSLYITDLGSANGTFLNGTRLLPHTGHIVQHGDTLRLGSLEITILFSTPNPTS